MRQIRLDAILSLNGLVKTVCTHTASATADTPETDVLDIEWLHNEFLRLGGHWEKGLQMYVRRGGRISSRRKPPSDRH